MVREVAQRTNDEAGDGTTTATVLAQSIVKEGMKAVAAGMNPMDLKRGIDRAVAAVMAEVKAMSRPVGDTDEIAKVGTISANGEVAIGRQIADAMAGSAMKASSPLKRTKASTRRPKWSRACSSIAATSAPIS